MTKISSASAHSSSIPKNVEAPQVQTPRTQEIKPTSQEAKVKDQFERTQTKPPSRPTEPSLQRGVAPATGDLSAFSTSSTARSRINSTSSTGQLQRANESDSNRAQAPTPSAPRPPELPAQRTQEPTPSVPRPPELPPQRTDMVAPLENPPAAAPAAETPAPAQGPAAGAVAPGAFLNPVETPAAGAASTAFTNPVETPIAGTTPATPAAPGAATAAAAPADPAAPANPANPANPAPTATAPTDPAAPAASVDPANPAAPGAHPTLERGAQGDEVRELQHLLSNNGHFVGATGADGDFGGHTESAVREFQRENQLPETGIADPATWDALARNAPAPGTSDLRFTPNPDALAAARNTPLAEEIAERAPMFADMYRQASEITGVPAELIAAIHANESHMSVRSELGPESGFGLDERYVTTARGNEILAQHGLGTWARGENTPEANLQSAVIAAETLRTLAASAGVNVGARMDQNDLAGAITAYAQGPGAGRRAFENGRSWLFDTSDADPRPIHPGGSSNGPNGEIISVDAGRKDGLLRWDVLLPLLQEQLRS